MADSSRDDSAAVLVGRLIRSYRLGAGRGGKRLTQEGLLSLMVERGENYAIGLDHSRVSRWERGERLAPREFLVALGRTLEIPKGEVDRMLSLAGDDRGEAILEVAQGIESRVETLQQDVRVLADSTAAPEPAADTAAVMKDALWRMTPPGVYALAVGFVLNAMGLNGTLALLIYVLIALAIALGQGVLRWLKPNRDHRDHVLDLFFISLFFTLNAPLLMGALTKSDHFGFYAFEAFTNTPTPFLLTILANLALSLVASVMFNLLWNRKYEREGGRSFFPRAAWTTLYPILFVYANIIIFTNLGAWIYFTVVLGILFGAFTTIVALNEPGIVVKDAGFVFKAAVMVTVILCTFGVAASYTAYLDPDIAVMAAYIRIIPLPEVSPQELGYSDEQGVKLLRLGGLWVSLATIVYLAVVVGGYLLATIRRLTAMNSLIAPPEKMTRAGMRPDVVTEDQRPADDRVC